MDLYGLLYRLIAKSDLTAIEKQDATAVIESLEKANAFGAAGKSQTQRHQCSVLIETGKCVHCGEPMQPPKETRNRWR